ncbi:MAG: hypothetical protein IJ026_05095, partial [Candidatus Methanomethylophilaceae archaeon]|nr:hypothetical protein [Candidatus Methanomethylophilaceae archaeon]
MKNRRGLLAVVMALAMVFAATTFVVGEADAAEGPVDIATMISGAEVKDGVATVELEKDTVYAFKGTGEYIKTTTITKEGANKIVFNGQGKTTVVDQTLTVVYANGFDLEFNN